MAAGPPNAVAGWPLGADLYAGNTVDAAGFTNLQTQGKTFAIAKSSQGTTRDGKFADYYQRIRDSGMIRGSYHFFSNKHSTSAIYGGTVADQAATVLALVTRLVPGDLAPALDLEDEPRNPANGHALDASQGGRYPLDQGLQPADQGYGYRRGVHAAWQDGRAELLADIQEFLDRLETTLGRTPIIYTSNMWKDTDMMDNPQTLAQHPLWTVYHGGANLAGISVGGWGNGWDFVQYAEAGGKWWNIDPYQEPNINIGGLDFDAYQGTIWGLRGLADIGRPGVALDSGVAYVAHSDADNGLHLLTGAPWTESQATQICRPDLTGADPAVLVSAGTAYLYFRGGDHLVEAVGVPASPSDWQTSQIEDAQAPVHDPRAVTSGGKRHVVYWGQDDDWYLLTWDNGWSSAGGILTAAGIKTSAGQGQSTGQPALYVTQGIVHAVGRAGSDGHLWDLWFDAGAWKKDDLTALARDLAPDLPAATYSPAAYETSSGVAIVFRAVGGDLWVVTRSDNAPTNLMSAVAQAPPGTGHPACFVLNDEPHVVYRGSDKLIYDVTLHGGVWRVQQVCAEPTAADPAAASDGTRGLVAARAMNGVIQAALFDGTDWTCTPTT